MEINQTPIDAVIPYVSNSRTHSDDQVAQIAASIKEFGFNNPVLLDGDKGIIAGHGRVLAARKLGLKDVPTIELAHLSENQRKAYIIADNKLALNAGWDMEMLSLEMGDLKDQEFDLSLLGFSDDELANIFVEATEGLTDPDEVPELPDDPVTVDGDVWLLGKHRIMCGDSTKKDHLYDLMKVGETLQPADLCFTSPPYAQQRDYKKEISDWDALMCGVFGALPVKDGAQVLVNLGLVHEGGRVNSYWDEWLTFMAERDWPLFGWYVWDQGHGMPGNWNGRLAPSHEFIFHFAKGPSQSNKWVDKKDESITNGGKNRTFRQKDGSMKAIYSPHTSAQPTKVADSVIRINRAPSESAKVGHPAMYPVALCEHIYNSYAKAGDIIYEPFNGGGTSIIACEQFGAACYAMELSPAYVDMAVKRWENFTGEKAKLEGSGKFFPTIKEDDS